MQAATFGWLCVETPVYDVNKATIKAATFGWLCVETPMQCKAAMGKEQPPSGGCVLKHGKRKIFHI